ncbi:hydrophobic surface binding protein A family protein [Metarhizium robertsii]|uniref:Cell wall galactomannoprotein n=2 Tax=Metarhizium robertsii TaxID=568076 RepID=E9EMJ2_METRA|nr:Cell wall galactomannoprotein [Metarhizium robertsii ARSEF 23]EFZ03625.1 Cell wall galactomannoprotein [Metarhizium robertsii ARSEF 23]EXV01985.1 hydrophobic surface binding protein A family protein [Metarhizium robertsii]
MQLKLLCLVTLAASVFAADRLAASLDIITHDYDKLNQGITAWPGDYESCVPLVSEADAITKALTTVKPPVTISPPDAATVKERQQAAQALCKSIDTYLEIAIEVKHKVDMSQPSVKPMVVAAIESLKAGFLALSTACLPVMTDTQSQNAFGRINEDMQIVLELYSSKVG